MRISPVWYPRIKRWPSACDHVEYALRHYLKALYPASSWVALTHGWMMGLCWFESRGNPNAVNRRVHTDQWRQASGLFQHLPRYWSADSRMEEGGEVAGRPMRVERTITALQVKGIDEPWMHNPETLIPLPIAPGRGILNPLANIAVAAWLIGAAGPGAWSPSKTVWPFEAYTDRTAWVEWGGIVRPIRLWERA